MDVYFPLKYFCNIDEKKIFWNFFFIFEMTKLLRFRKKCLLRPTSYIHEINFTKKSDLKYFENQFFFYFLIENFMPTKIAMDVYFPS